MLGEYYTRKMLILWSFPLRGFKEETGVKGQVLRVGDLELGLMQSSRISIDLNTCMFDNGAHILLYTRDCRDVPLVLTSGGFNAHCTDG